MSFRLTNIFRVAQPKPADSLGQGSFDSGPRRIELLEGLRGLPLPRYLQGLMLVAWPQFHRPRSLFRLRAARPQGAGTTILGVKLDGDDRLSIPLLVVALRPAHAALSCRTGYRLPIPIDREARDIQSVRLACLPTIVRQHRAKQIDLVVLLTRDEQISGDIPAIQQVLAWQQIALRQVRMDRFGHA